MCLEKVNNGDSTGDRRSTASCLYDRESKTVDGNYGCSYMMEKQGFKATPDKAIPTIPGRKYFSELCENIVSLS